MIRRARRPGKETESDSREKRELSQKKQGTEERGCGLLRIKRLLIERIAQV